MMVTQIYEAAGVEATLSRGSAQVRAGSVESVAPRWPRHVGWPSLWPGLCTLPPPHVLNYSTVSTCGNSEIFCCNVRLYSVQVKDQRHGCVENIRVAWRRQ